MCTAYVYNVGELQSSPWKDGFDLEQFHVRSVGNNMALRQVFIEFGFLLSASFHKNSIFTLTFMFVSSDREAGKAWKTYSNRTSESLERNLLLILLFSIDNSGSHGHIYATECSL